MLEVPIVYFSASGNTKYISELAKKGLERQNLKINLISISKVKKQKLNLDKIPFLGIASPVYEFNLSRVIRHWMETIPKSVIQKKVFFINTSGGIPCSSIEIAEQIMKEKNYQLIGALEIAAPGTEPFFSQRWYPLSWCRSVIDRSFYFGLKVGYNIRREINEYVDFTIRLPGLNFLSKWMYKLESEKAYKLEGYIKFRRNKCNNCHICEKTCPVDAIKIERIRVIDPYKCMICATCVRVCPTNAFYLTHRPKAIIPKRSIAPKLIKGYVDPENYVPPKKFIYSKNLFSNFF